MYFNVNFNVFFKLIKVHLLMSELYMKMRNFTEMCLESISLFKIGKKNKHLYMETCANL